MTEPATILCIDDVAQNIKLLEAVLESSGYVVLWAASGKEGLELVAQRRPDLVLLDIMMPEMDGYEVYRRIREDPATQMLPVVMITASGAAEKVKAIEAGADDFISKPFNKADLLARVRSLLRIKESYDTIQRQRLELADWNRSLETRAVAGRLKAAGSLSLEAFAALELLALVVLFGTLLFCVARQLELFLDGFVQALAVFLRGLGNAGVDDLSQDGVMVASEVVQGLEVVVFEQPVVVEGFVVGADRHDAAY